MEDNLTKEGVVSFAADTFREYFKCDPIHCGCAPGRVNLIGEHTDYNGGFVLPMALPLVTVMVGKKSDSGKCHILTTSKHVDDPKDIEFDLPTPDNPLVPGKPSWANYVKGVMANFKGSLCGFNAVITTSIPVGGGLSSSAALEVATYTFLESMMGDSCNVSLHDKAISCQKAEHEFAEVPCGIMDQFISFMGKKDHALLLDCRSLDFTLVPVKDKSIAVLITNTNVRHKLASSEYSARRKHCEEAAKIVGKKSLREVTMDEVDAFQKELGEEIHRRARHVVSEIHRTREAAAALEKGDYTEFGNLMCQSHQSLRNDYEVSCPELDEVVEAALEVDGVYGSRMTGGGFGGCTVTLLKTEAISKVIENIKEKYNGNPTFYVCRPGNGSQKVKITE